MEAFVHNGDFDFNVFTQIPGPTIEPKPKVEKKRKEREPVPTWMMRNRKAERDGKQSYEIDPYDIQQNTPPVKKQHTVEEGEEQAQASHAKHQQTNNTKQAANTNRTDNTISNKKQPNNTKQNSSNNYNHQTIQSQKSWDFDAKELWEPDAADIANTINIEQAESMFLGEFSDTGLSDRLVSTITNNMDLKEPTVIQHHAIPQILQGQDVLIKAETGSGKTLTYLLPVLNVLGDMQPHITRDQGAYAIILAPTRELVSQIFDVVTQVAKTWIWVVPGYLSGGENKSSEKTRLRKGVTVLVSTPGRLMDHLQTTHSFVYDRLRFLVLDEADRLLDMGMGPEVAEIVEFLKTKCGGDGATRTKTEDKESSEPRRTGTHPNKASANNRSTTSNGKTEPKDSRPETEVKPKVNKTIKFEYDDGYEPKKEVVLEGKKFQTIMASATLHNGIRQLAFVALHKPVYIGLKPQAVSEFSSKKKRADIESGQTYNTPTKLTQYSAVVRTKDRPSSLISFLKEHVKETTKVLVFVASCASANFFYNVLRGATADIGVIQPKKRPGVKTVSLGTEKAIEKIPLVDAPIFRLHGDLSQVERNTATNKFRSEKTAVMIATDVAARGLDFPDLDWIIQFDPPTDTKDYIHRAGRTARMGRKGQSILYITPEEREYLTYLQGFGIKMESMKLPGDITTQRLIEAYVRHDSHAYITAKSAYISAVRAYATHTSATKHIFNVANLHVGHLAKAFCLHDKPSMLATTAKNEEAARAKEKEQKKKEREAFKAYTSAPKRMEKSEFEAGI